MVTTPNHSSLPGYIQDNQVVLLIPLESDLTLDSSLDGYAQA